MYDRNEASPRILPSPYTNLPNSCASHLRAGSHSGCAR